MDYIKIAEDLILLDTSVPPGSNYEQAVDYLLPLFQGVGFEAQKIKIPEAETDGRTGRFALVGHRRNPRKTRLIFYAHIDVVPAEGWAAFQPRVENGRIYGRGAADMKGGLVALLLGLDKIKEKTTNYDISVMVTTDEEYSQAGQLCYLAQFLQPVSGANVFSLDSNFGFVSIANLGLLQMDIMVKGKSVHSGLAHLGVNAVEEAIPLINALLELKNKVVQRKSRIEVSPDTGLSYMEGRLNINMVRGGIKSNIVPDECLIAIDRRLIPEENVADAEKEIMDTLHSVPGVDWEMKKVFKIPTVSPSRGGTVDKLSGIIKRVTGKTGQYGEMGSGDLSAIVALDWEGQDFGLGVIRTECNIHGKEEFVYIKDIEDVAEIISRFLAE
jgi:succinyl-diaminopimelate desuccinylase